MNVARLNFSHGDEDTFENIILTIRELSNDIAILIDLPGPKIRTKKQLRKDIVLKKNSDIILSNIKEFSDEKNIAVDYKYLTKDVARNNLIFIDDGKIKLKVLFALNKNELLCKIIKEGILKTEKGVNFLNVSLSVPSVTDNDFKVLKFGAEHNADMFAVSFVRKSDDIETVKIFLEKNYPSKKFFIISKIEKSEAVQNIYKITEISDGIMVARGDLGVETPIETIALKQKMIISVANSLNKPVITATQMLESMVSNESPTRAEVTDITNALLDGTDAVMLSEETAIGLYPQLSVSYMEKIIETTEESSFFKNLLFNGGNNISNVSLGNNNKYNNNENKKILNNNKTCKGIDNISYAAAKMAVSSSFIIKDSFIAAITRTGYTANLISSFRPIVPIIAIVPDLSVKRRLTLNFGVISLVMEKIAEKHVQIKEIIEFIIGNSGKIKNKKFKLSSNFRYAIITGGLPLGDPGSTDFVRIIDLNKN